MKIICEYISIRNPLTAAQGSNFTRPGDVRGSFSDSGSTATSTRSAIMKGGMSQLKVDASERELASTPVC